MPREEPEGEGGTDVEERLTEWTRTRARCAQWTRTRTSRARRWERGGKAEAERVFTLPLGKDDKSMTVAVHLGNADNWVVTSVNPERRTSSCARGQYVKSEALRVILFGCVYRCPV